MSSHGHVNAYVHAGDDEQRYNIGDAYVYGKEVRLLYSHIGHDGEAYETLWKRDDVFCSIKAYGNEPVS